MADIERDDIEDKSDDTAAPPPPEHDSITDNDVSPTIKLKDDEGDDVESEAQEPQETEGRKDRRKKHIRALEREREARLAAEQRIAALEARMQYAQPPMQQAPVPQADPVDAELGAIRDLRYNIIHRLKTDASLDPTEANRLMREAERLDDRRIELITRRAAPPVQQGPSQVDIENRLLAAEFPQVFNDDAARLAAQAELIDLVKKGEPMGIATARKAAQRVSERRYGRPAAAPAASQQARYGGVSSRPTTGTGGNGVRLSSQQMRLARAYSPGLDDAAAAEKWAREIGRPEKLL